MTDNELDNLFRKAFEGDEMPVPADMWARIQPPEKEKRRGFVWWIWLTTAAVVILAGTATWLYKHDKHNNEDSKVAVVKSSAEQNKINTQTVQPKAVPEQQTSSSEQSSALNNSIAFERKEKIVRNNLSYNSTVRNFNQFNQNSVTKNNDKVSDNNLPLAENQLPAGSKQTDNADQYQNNNTIITANDSSSALLLQPQVFTKADSNNIVTAAKPVHVKKFHNRRVPAIEWLISAYTSDRKIYDVQKQTPVSPNMAVRDPQTKATIYGFSGSVRLVKPITKNISVKTGLQFSQTRQSISYLQETVNEYSVINATGVNIDTARYAQISMKRPTLQSLYNSVNLPVLFSYEQGNQLKAGLTAGVIVNLFSWYKGDVPSADYQDMVKAKNVFRINNGASLYFSASVSKSFSNWQLFAEPSVQYGLSSITKNTALFKQKMNNYGVSIGIRKNFQTASIKK